ncbi:guanine nucleotide binding protein, alpha subunit [Mycena leptocephala]|nr:guanine nucleotide binding protein, alpha subunit [Mycena leptocephala]
MSSFNRTPSFNYEFSRLPNRSQPLKLTPKLAPTLRQSVDDPLAAALRPPHVERYSRLKAASDAKLFSDVDEHESKQRQKSRAEVQVLLLGQSESGKTTCLKQFQLLHNPAAFHMERIAWRAVIYLNLVRSVRRILDALADNSASIIISSNNRSPSAGTNIPNFEGYRRRLEPLIQLEDRLIRLLSSADEDEATHFGPWENVAPQPNTLQTQGQISTSTSPTSSIAKEVASKSPKSEYSDEIQGWWEDPDDPVHTLHACAPYMQEMWRDPSVRRCLQEKRIRLEESSGFFLDEIPRITAKKYIPTDADVVKARLKTIGVVEHTFSISSGSNRGKRWKIYDVGGSRNQRQAWTPYFEDINAIIFLAPISAFDQCLAEDPLVNRLEDSLQLWQAVVSNKLLAKVNIVLFLNKCDLLQAKLDAGVRLNKHMISYGDRPNDYDSVSKYFRNKFGALHHAVTPNKERELYIHLTTATDIRRTATIIATTRDDIIKGHLKSMKLI